MLALQSADVFERKDVQEHGDALEVMIRSSWHAPGRDSVDVPIEFCILLCTAGPAVRIVGDLNKYGEPVSARTEHQSWFNPFETWVGNCGSVEKILLALHAALISANIGHSYRTVRQQSSNGEMHIPQPIAARPDPLQLLVTRSHKVVYWLGSSLHAASLFVWPAPERLTCSSG